LLFLTLADATNLVFFQDYCTINLIKENVYKMRAIKLIKHLILVAFSLILFSCKREPELINGYSVSSTKLYYKICTIGDGTKHPKNGDYLLLHVKYKTQNDSLFYHSNHQAWKGYFVEYKKNKDAVFLSYFSEMIEGDSMQFMVPTASFFKEIFKNEIPYFCEKDSIVKVELKFIAIMDAQDKDLYAQSKRIEKIENAKFEKDEMLNYAKNNFKDFDTISGGIFFKHLKKTSDSTISLGKSIAIKYRGYYTDNELFDNSVFHKSVDFTYGSQGQLLQGMQIVLRKMRKGEIVKFILPSQLAFGEQGSSDGLIPPFCPLVYELEVTDVK